MTVLFLVPGHTLLRFSLAFWFKLFQTQLTVFLIKLKLMDVTGMSLLFFRLVSTSHDPRLQVRARVQYSFPETSC